MTEPFFDDEVYRQIQTWEFLSVADIAEALRITPRKVARFCEEGIIVAGERGTGRGSPRMFSIWHVALFQVALELEAFGVKQSGLRELTTFLTGIRSTSIEQPRGSVVRIRLDGLGGFVVETLEKADYWRSPVAIEVNWHFAEMEAVSTVTSLPQHQFATRGFQEVMQSSPITRS